FCRSEKRNRGPPVRNELGAQYALIPLSSAWLIRPGNCSHGKRMLGCGISLRLRFGGYSKRAITDRTRRSPKASPPSLGRYFSPSSERAGFSRCAQRHVRAETRWEAVA